MAQRDEFEWLNAWVDQHLSLTLTFARGVSGAEMCRAFGADPDVVETLTFEEAADVQAPGPGGGRGPLSAWTLHLLRTQGADPARIRALEAVRDGDVRDLHKVRIGECDPWVYAVEVFTTRGAQVATLEALSKDGAEAVSLSYTPTIAVMLYARDGLLLSGIDMTVPHLRYGADGQHFDSVMSAAGLVGNSPMAPAAGARLVQLAFGVTVDREMLERPLPAALLPD